MAQLYREIIPPSLNEVAETYAYLLASIFGVKVTISTEKPLDGGELTIVVDGRRGAVDQ